MDNQGKLHIAVFPWLAYGHFVPFLEVASFLARKGHRVSFISTPKNLQKLPQNLPASLTLVKLPLPRVYGLPDSAESTADLPNDKVPYLKKAYDMLEPSINDFLASSTVDWIIVDFASYWLPPIAQRLGVNSVYFNILNSSCLAFYGSPSLALDGRGSRPEDMTRVPEWINYPSKIALRLHEVMSHNDCEDFTMPDHVRFGKSATGSKFIAVRTCREFEPESLTLLEKLYEKSVFPLGLLPPRVIRNLDGDERWIALKKWLNNKTEKSVFYVAFGSEVTLNQEVMHELARGIEKSNLPFIWVLSQKARSNSIPPGFEARVADRGFIWLGWAPQLNVLAHPSVGGFLTHCGWSSIIEALGLGIPLILFSGANADQGLHARLMDERGLGFEVPRDELDGSFTSESVAETIRRIMVEPEGEQVRANAWAMRDIFGNVELQDRYLDEFARALEDGRRSTCSG